MERRQEGSSEVLLPDDAAIVKTLAGRFGLSFPAGTRFPYEDS
jgi:hypothetical protein